MQLKHESQEGQCAAKHYMQDLRILTSDGKWKPSPKDARTLEGVLKSKELLFSNISAIPAAHLVIPALFGTKKASVGDADGAERRPFRRRFLTALLAKSVASSSDRNRFSSGVVLLMAAEDEAAAAEQPIPCGVAGRALDGAVSAEVGSATNLEAGVVGVKVEETEPGCCCCWGCC